MNSTLSIFLGDILTIPEIYDDFQVSLYTSTSENIQPNLLNDFELLDFKPNYLFLNLLTMNIYEPTYLKDFKKEIKSEYVQANNSTSIMVKENEHSYRIFPIINLVIDKDNQAIILEY